MSSPWRLTIGALALGLSAMLAPQAAKAQDRASVCRGVTAGWDQAVASGNATRISAAKEAARPLSRQCPDLQRRIAGYEAEQRRIAERREREAEERRAEAARREREERSRRAEAERLRRAQLRCDGLWQTATERQTLDGFEGFVRTCADHREAPAARANAAFIRANPFAIAGLPADNVPIPREGLSPANQGYAAQCEARNGHACTYLADRFRSGDTAPKNELWAATLYLRGCLAHYANGCGMAGVVISTGSGTQRDSARASLFDQRGCDAGALFACINWGHDFEFGQGGTAIDFAKAANLYERACNSGNTGGYFAGCRDAARIYSTGQRNVPQDRARARQLAEAGLRLEPQNAALLGLKERLTPSTITGRCNAGPYIVFFGSGQTFVTPEAASVLNSAITQYSDCGNARVMLAGHSDTQGSLASSMSLSQRRNASVQAFLTARGIPQTRITAQAFGENVLRVPTGDGVSELQNRRVEITFVP